MADNTRYVNSNVVEAPPTPDWVIRRARRAVRSALRTTTLPHNIDVALVARLIVAELDGQWLLRGEVDQ